MLLFFSLLCVLLYVLTSVFIIKKLTGRLKLYEDYIMLTLTSIKAAYLAMKKIDHSGAFENDDDVGSVFGELADVIYYLRDITDLEEIEETEELDDSELDSDKTWLMKTD